MAANFQSCTNPTSTVCETFHGIKQCFKGGYKLGTLQSKTELLNKEKIRGIHRMIESKKNEIFMGYIHAFHFAVYEFKNDNDNVLIFKNHDVRRVFRKVLPLFNLTNDSDFRNSIHAKLIQGFFSGFCFVDIIQRVMDIYTPDLNTNLSSEIISYIDQNRILQAEYTLSGKMITIDKMKEGSVHKIMEQVALVANEIYVRFQSFPNVDFDTPVMKNIFVASTFFENKIGNRHIIDEKELLADKNDLNIDNKIETGLRRGDCLANLVRRVIYNKNHVKTTFVDIFNDFRINHKDPEKLKTEITRFIENNAQFIPLGIILDKIQYNAAVLLRQDIYSGDSLREDYLKHMSKLYGSCDRHDVHETSGKTKSGVKKLRKKDSPTKKGKYAPNVFRSCTDQLTKVPFPASLQCVNDGYKLTILDRKTNILVGNNVTLTGKTDEDINILFETIMNEQELEYITFKYKKITDIVFIFTNKQLKEFYTDLINRYCTSGDSNENTIREKIISGLFLGYCFTEILQDIIQSDRVLYFDNNLSEIKRLVGINFKTAKAKIERSMNKVNLWNESISGNINIQKYMELGSVIAKDIINFFQLEEENSERLPVFENIKISWTIFSNACNIGVRGDVAKMEHNENVDEKIFKGLQKGYCLVDLVNGVYLDSSRDPATIETLFVKYENESRNRDKLKSDIKEFLLRNAQFIPIGKILDRIQYHAKILLKAIRTHDKNYLNYLTFMSTLYGNCNRHDYNYLIPQPVRTCFKSL